MVIIKKLRLYLETTIFNYYFDEDRDGHKDTVRLFEAIGAGEYEAYTSEYVVFELKKTKEPKRSNMLNLIEMYNIHNLDVNPEAERLAEEYLDNGVIPARYWFDSMHIAVSSIHELDCVVSYNFEHINRPKTKILVERVNFKENYKGIVICTSNEVLDDEL
jgi:predicted nucleic acid-binding protein